MPTGAPGRAGPGSRSRVRRAERPRPPSRRATPRPVPEHPRRAISRGQERQLAPAVSPFAEAAGYSRVVRVGQHVFVAGTAPIMPEDADPPPNAFGQTERCLAIALEAIAQVGGRAEDVVRTRLLLTRAADLQ